MIRTLLLSIPLAFLIMACGNNPNSKKEIYHVSGNCGMCQKTIEGSLKMEGIYSCEWNSETKELTVEFDTTKLNKEKILTAVSQVGYDNELCKASDEKYNKLHKCCQYEREN